MVIGDSSGKPLVKCVTCQREFDGEKFSVDCPHETELTPYLLEKQRRSTSKPPVVVPPYQHKSDAEIAAEMVAGLDRCVVPYHDLTVKPEQITDEMVTQWYLANVKTVDITKGGYSKEMIANAINIWLERSYVEVNPLDITDINDVMLAARINLEETK